MKYTIWATTKNGDGNVQDIGILDTDNMEDFQIRVGMFASDVVITVEERMEQNDEAK